MTIFIGLLEIIVTVFTGIKLNWKLMICELYGHWLDNSVRRTSAHSVHIKAVAH